MHSSATTNALRYWVPAFAGTTAERFARTHRPGLPLRTSMGGRYEHAAHGTLLTAAVLSGVWTALCVPSFTVLRTSLANSSRVVGCFMGGLFQMPPGRGSAMAV